jgi:hypothetical protein
MYTFSSNKQTFKHLYSYYEELLTSQSGYSQILAGSVWRPKIDFKFCKLRLKIGKIAKIHKICVI